MEYKNLNIKWLGHDGFLINFNSMNIYIDPIKLSDFSEKISSSLDEKKADVVLITHGHYDHLSVEDIRGIIKPGTKIIGPAEVLSQTRQIKDGIDFQIADSGDKINFNDIVISPVDSYNINKPFHSKGDGLGYVIDFSGTKVYHAGDTDLIPEMNSIKADVVLLPVSGKVVMNADEAARAAEIIHPDLAIPIHWGTLMGTLADAEKFVRLCSEKGINVKIIEKEI